MFRLIKFYDNVIVILSLILLIVRIRLLSIFSTRLVDRVLIQENTLEVLWTLIPFFMLIFIALPSLEVLYIIEDNYNLSLVTKSIGHQWYWSYEYRDFKDLEFDSYMIERNFRLLETDNSLVLPVKSHICILTTSSDVIHSWTIPCLGLKRDSIPGRLNQIFFIVQRSGVFYGQCSEICGSNHRFMPIKLEILPLDYFRNWLKNRV